MNVLGWLKSRLSRQRPAAGDGEYPRLCPDTAVAIVGDIHGRADLLDRILAKISDRAPGAVVVFVGDYVDRGPDSRAVIDRLRGLSGAICLRGNHETMLIEFLDDPIECGGRWVRNGGSQTLASYGIELDENSGSADVLAARQNLARALGDGTEDWLRALPLTWSSGNLLVTHAGPDPAAPIEGQEDRVFLWGHSRFLRDRRSDGLWVAHGHWIRDRPSCTDGRISVDTGAWHTGHLSAALIAPNGQVEFART